MKRLRYAQPICDDHYTATTKTDLVTSGNDWDGEDMSRLSDVCRNVEDDEYENDDQHLRRKSDLTAAHESVIPLMVMMAYLNNSDLI